MKKYIAPLMMILLVVYSNAMEIVKQDPSIPCNDICYLNQMPREILNYIAHFLIETKKEFVARIRVECEEQQKEREEEQKAIAKRGWIPECGYIKTLRACNIERTKCLFFCGGALTLFDYLNLDEKCINTQYSYQEERELNYMSIALSQKGQMFASYYYKDCSCEKCPCEEPDMEILEITKIDTQKKQDKNHVLILKESRKLYSGESLYFDKMAFNKQGNKLLVCNSYETFDPKIFSLKAIDSKKEQEIVRTNKLQKYLKDKFVCDRYIEGRK
jgi:hypothetical protein